VNFPWCLLSLQDKQPTCTCVCASLASCSFHVYYRNVKWKRDLFSKVLLLGKVLHWILLLLWNIIFLQEHSVIIIDYIWGSLQLDDAHAEFLWTLVISKLVRWYTHGCMHAHILIQIPYSCRRPTYHLLCDRKAFLFLYRVLPSRFSFHRICNGCLMFFNLFIFQLTEDVARKKTEYQKYLELYKLMRSRFEEHYVKCK
jgi:hypothetical protein